MAVPNINGFRVKKGNETGIAKIDTDALLDKAVTKAKLSQPVQTEINKVANKADQDGDYDSLTAGGAKQLLSTVYVDDNEPYNFRTSGGSADIGDRMYEEVVGGSIVWNQLYKPYGMTKLGLTITVDDNGIVTLNGTATSGWFDGFGSTTMKKDHVYIMATRVISNPDNVTFKTGTLNWPTSMVPVGNSIVLKKTGSDTLTAFGCESFVADTVFNNVKFTGYFCDLTQMFGSTIADYIYSLEQGTAGAGVAWFKKLFPKPYYAYNAGELMHVQTTAKESVGFNAWDEEITHGYFGPQGDWSSDQTIVSSKNPIPVLPNTRYYFRADTTSNCYVTFWTRAVPSEPSGSSHVDAFISRSYSIINSVFTTPSDCHYIHFNCGSAYGSTYKNDICINLSWDGERNDEYEPYEKHTYPLAELELRGIPKLDANNQLYYDGDTYASDGTVTRKYGVRAYQSGDANSDTMLTDGTKTVYKLTTPTTETADPYTNPQIVDDFGTEEYTDYAVEAGDRDVAIPVGHNSQYMSNLRAKLEMAPDSPDGDGDYIVRQSNGQNSYVPYTADGRLTALEAKIPSPPSPNGTYKLTATVTDGGVTYTWTAD